MGGTDYDSGGDIYLVRPGIEERLIVSRGKNKTWNVCPLFSPDGSMLAYGEREGAASALVILDVTSNGSVSERSRLSVPAGAAALCPGWWSADGSMVGYLQFDSSAYEENPTPSLHFRGVDGSAPADVAQAPTAEEVLAKRDEGGPLLSPLGDRVTRSLDDLVVIRPDGSRRELARTTPGYSIAAWSPDGRRLLVMFGRRSWVRHDRVLVDGPKPQIIVPFVQVNGLRSWPGRGDVSWQAVSP